MRKKYSILFVAILCIGLLISAGTYAFWTWNSNLNKNVVFNVASGFEQYIIYDEGDSSFIGNFQPSDNYCNALRNTISFRKTTDDVDFYATIYMDVKEIGYNISNSDSVYWIVTSGDSTGCTGNLSDALSYGTFKGMSNGSVIEMLNNIEVTTTEQKYTIWIWLDRSGDNISELSGETLNTNVWTQFDMYPSDGLDGGSVVISGDNEVGSILTANITNTTPDADSYTYQWYTHTENLTTGGILIDGATSNTLTVNNNYAGKYIYVVVTAIKDNSISKSLTDITDIRNNKYAFVPKLDAVMTVSVSSLNITYPNSGSFTYTYNGDGIVTCSSSDTSVSECSVNPSTKTVTVSSKKEGTANITLSASQGTTYDAISQIIPVTIQVQSYPIRYYSDNTIVPWKSETKMHGDNTYTLTSDVPVKRGYIFKEWNTSKDGTGTSYSPGSIYSANSSVSLYAVWELGVFSINEDFEDTTYDSNITSITNPTSSPFTTGVSGGSTSNYLWSVSDGKFRTNAGSVKSTNYGNVTSTASITSTIVIQPTKDTTLSFDYGLFLNESNSAYLSILLNDTQIIYVTSDTDTSYSTNLEANTKYTLEFIAHHSTEVVYGGVLKTTAYAFIDNLVVNESIIYTVSYDANGGAGAPASQTKAEGESLILSSTVPTRTGFNFISWNTSTSGIGTSYNPGDEYSADASVTLYAIWQEKGVITNDNIGEYIDLGNDIIGTGGSTSDDWRILYVENGNIYAILADFLPNSSNYASGAGLNLVTNKSYGVNSTVGRADLLTKLTTNSNWSGLTNGITGAMATGAPTEELILNSYRTDAGKEPTNNTFDSTIENYSLYVSQTGDYNGTHNYWLATEASGSTTDLRGIRYSGEIRQDSYNNEYMGLRPVVMLPSSVNITQDGNVWVVNNDSGGNNTSLTVNKSTLNISYLNTDTVTYTYNGNGQLSCNSSNTSVATCSVNTGNKTVNVSSVGVGNAILTLSAAATSTSDAVSQNISVSVSRINPTMTVSVSSLNLTYPNSGNFTYTYNGDGTISCSSSDTSVSECSVNTFNKTVTVTSKKVGTANITLSASQGANYNVISKTVAVDVQYASYAINYYSNITSDESPWMTDTKIYGENYTIISNSPSRDGYSFLGWSTSSTDPTVIYESGDIYSTNGKLDLYAVWQVTGSSVITNNNIGEYIDLGNDIIGTGGSTSDDWRILYVENGNIYAILADFLPNSSNYASDAGLNLVTNKSYGVNSTVGRADLLTKLTTNSNWSGLTNGITGAMATGAPTEELILNSYRTEAGKEPTNNTFDSTIENYSLYVSQTGDYNGTHNYWLATEASGSTTDLRGIRYSGEIRQDSYNNEYMGLRPVVVLPSSVRFSKDGDVWVVNKGISVTNDDIGKYIDLGNDIIGTGGSTSDDWRILYVENGNIYAILADFLPNSSNYASDAGLNLVTNKSYGVNSTVNRADLLTKLTTNSNWSGLTNGITGATATGAPTEELILNSYRTEAGKEPTNNTFDSTIANYSLYVSRTGDYNGTHNYWLATEASGSTTDLRGIRYSGEIRQDSYNNEYMGLRPVVVLPSSVIVSKDGDVLAVNKDISITNNNINEDFEDTTYDSNITSITSPTISASTTGGLTGASSFDFLWSVTDGMLRTNSESFNGSIISQKTLNSGDITSTIVFTPTSNKTLSFKYGLVKNGSSSTSLVIKLNNTEVVSVTGDTDTTYTTNLTANTTYTLELIHSHTSSSMMSSVTTAYAFIDDLIVN